MQRETTKVITPVGKVEVVLNAWLTGGEKMETPTIDQTKYIDWLFEKLLVAPSLDDVKEMHGKDFDFLLKKALEIVSDSNWEESKKA